MKKIYILLLAIAACCTSSYGQHYPEDFIIDNHGSGSKLADKIRMVYGVMAGTTLPTIKIDDESPNLSGRAGFQMGMMWGVDFGRLELVPEIWYENNKMSFTSASPFDGTELRSKSIEMPILLGINIIDELRVNMGPSFVLYNDTTATTPVGDELEVGKIKSTTGYAFGFSYVAWEHLLLDARYVGRFATTNNSLDGGSTMAEISAYSFNFSVGYKF